MKPETLLTDKNTQQSAQTAQLPENPYARRLLLDNANEVRKWLSDLLGLVNLHYDEVNKANQSHLHQNNQRSVIPHWSRDRIAQLERGLNNYLCDVRFSRCHT